MGLLQPYRGARGDPAADTEAVLVTSVVGAGAPGGMTPQEHRNIAIVRELLEAPKPLSAEDEARLAPQFRLRRLGMDNLAEMLVGEGTDHREHAGYTRDSFRDRRDEIVDVIARDDVVWVIFRLTGHHTGSFWGMPGTQQPLDLLELGIFRIDEGKVAEGWFMNDELAICRQLGMIDTQVLIERVTQAQGDHHES